MSTFLFIIYNFLKNINNFYYNFKFNLKIKLASHFVEFRPFYAWRWCRRCRLDTSVIFDNCSVFRSVFPTVRLDLRNYYIANFVMLTILSVSAYLLNFLCFPFFRNFVERLTLSPTFTEIEP